jgi:ATP-binding cassette, subfamily B, bacterial PglK
MNFFTTISKGADVLSRRQKVFFCVYLLAGLLLAGVDAVVLMQIQRVFEMYSAGKDITVIGIPTSTFFLLAAISLLFFLKNIGYIVFNFMKQNFLHQIQRSLSKSVYERFLSSASGFLTSMQPGMKVSYATYEPLQVVLNTYTSFMNLVTEAAVILLMVSALLLIHPIETLIIFSVLASVIVGYQYFTKEWLSKSGDDRKNADAFRNEWVRSSLNGLLQIRSLALEKFFLDRYDSSTAVSCDMVRNKAFVTDSIKNVIELAVLLSLTIVSFSNLKSDLPGLLAFIGVFAFAAYRMMPSLNRVLISTQSMRYGSSSLETLHRILFQPTFPERQSSDFAEPITLDFFIKKLVGKNKHVLMENSKISLRQGDFLLIKGPSGIGKSTLAEAMLLGDENIECKINGVWVHGLAHHRNLVSFSGQNPMVFAGTLKENLVFTEDIPVPATSILVDILGDDSPASVLNQSNFVANLDNTISDKSLSGGQLARVDIIRTILRKADIYIFDEPTSALDGTRSKHLAAYLKELSRGSIVIVITHDTVFDEFSTKTIEIQ